ncbi:MAG: cobalamin-dependent protein [Deltaproteobacteria bacterium]|nr:cobalamin-dependent protein [Deltaproteobacteria bacterium]MBW1819231.1 cobalamin-dependent protein [Deltaproteobacteria bacterium]MBW2285630.1 cobalamin-dependent protein [Deltaproteobacteria bacterium]
MSNIISDALVKFDRDVFLEAVKKALNDGTDPMVLVRDLQEGMRLVGERFKTGNYFLSELMMSADLFSQAMKLIEPKLEGMVRETIGKILIGTPKGDIHDLGKNIFSTVAKGAGFEVVDLGVDVPAERFVEAVEDVKPDILGFSALITTAFESMKTVADALTERGLRDDLKIIVGGGVTIDKVLTYVGADAQTIDAVEGLALCRKFVGQSVGAEKI